MAAAERCDKMSLREVWAFPLPLSHREPCGHHGACCIPAGVGSSSTATAASFSPVDTPGEKQGSPLHRGSGSLLPRLGHAVPRDCRAVHVSCWQFPTHQPAQRVFVSVSLTRSCLGMSLLCQGVPTHLPSARQRTFKHDSQKAACRGHVASYPKPASYVMGAWSAPSKRESVSPD